MRKILEDAWKVNELEDQFQNDCFSVEEIEKFYPELFVDGSLEDDDFALFMKENNE